jgi:serine phosphatase RsbU (regulator of sigma subunit)
MKLRTQLLLFFLIFGIVPLLSLTLYSYYSSIRAFRKVVDEESKVMAHEMGRHMETVARDLQRRVQRAEAPLFQKFLEHSQEAMAAEASKAYSRLVDEMGEMAGIVESIEFGRHPRTPPPPHPPRAPRAAPGLKEKELDSVVVYMPPPGGGGPLEVALTEDNRLVFACPEEDVLDAGGAPTTPDQLPLTSEQLQRRVEAATKVAAKVQESAMAAAKLRLEIHEDDLKRLVKRDSEKETISIRFGSPAGKDDKEAQSGDGTIRAQLRARRVLHAVSQGVGSPAKGILFAVDSRGGLYTRDPEDASRLAGLDVSRLGGANGPGSETGMPGDWIISTVREPFSSLTLGIARPIGESLREIRTTAAYNLGYGLAIIGFASLAVLPLSRRMTRDLDHLTDGVEQLASGNLDVEVSVRSRDEFGTLAAAFNRMARDLKQQQLRLVEQERIKRELEMSQRIQQELLPREPLRTDRVTIQGLSLPALEMGGDFYNYFQLPGGETAFLIGDVSGKGMPSALLMANMQATLSARLQHERDLGRLAAELDAEISRQTEPQAYATLFMGLLSADARKLRWVSAGHNPQLAHTADGQLLSLESSGRPLGLLPGGDFSEGSMDLNPGDWLLLYTDGLVETVDPTGEEFGMQRLQSVLREKNGDSPQEVLTSVVDAVNLHRQDAKLFDDVTLLTLRIG